MVGDASVSVTLVVAYCAVAGSRKEGRLLLRRRRHRRRRLRLLRPCWCLSLNLNRRMLLWLLLLMLWPLMRMWMWGLKLRLRRLGGEDCMLGMDLKVSICLGGYVLTCRDQPQGAVTGITRRIGAQAAHPVCPLESESTLVLSAAEIPIVVVHVPGAVGAGGRFDLGSAVRPSRTADIVLYRVLFSGTF